MDKLRIAVAQLNFCVGDIRGNKNKILRYINKAKDNNADIICFPELALTGYPPEDLLLNGSFVKENIKALNDIKRYCGSIIAVVGFADKQNPLFNAAAIISNGKIIDFCHKHHLPNYGVFDEQRYFKKGKRTVVYELDKIRFGVNICEDIWIEGDPTRAQSTVGDAQIIINISSSPYYASKVQQREEMLRTRAKDYCCYVVFCNLTGGQDELVFDGHSCVIDNSSNIISRASGFKEQLLITDINAEDIVKRQLTLPREKQKKSGNSVKSSRVEIIKLGRKLKKKAGVGKRLTVAGFYSEHEEIFKALVLGTTDYIRKNGFKRVVIGLSGGIDSSLVAAVAVQAIGAKNVTGVLMPSQYSSEGSITDATILSENLGIEIISMPIKKLFDQYGKALSDIFRNKGTDITEENIQARIRGNILMALSNKFGWLVLTTANKSETSVGYSTLYGDMAGGFAVIKDVPKTMVYKLCEYYNEIKRKDIIPKSVLEKPPSAELRPDQKDTDSLPPYDILDPILKAYIEDDLGIDEIVMLGNKKELVEKVIKMVDTNEYKRRQAAPGVKITPKAFGKDRRFPITNRFHI
jgi:NAD+ synthase (glutamine-hydrolysing)